jgi:signal transduction histidine kinase
MDVVPDNFKTILEITGSLNGRLLLITKESNQSVVISVNEGFVNVDTVHPIPKVLLDEVENFTPQQGQEVFVAHSQGDRRIPKNLQPEPATSSWSEILVPLQLENSTIGVLSASKPESDLYSQEDILQFSLFARQLTGALLGVKFKMDWQSAEERIQEILQESHELAAILVHDLQGPLGNVLASLELLQTEVGSGVESSPSPMMDIAIRSSKVLEAMVNSLLDITRFEAGQEITDLEPVAVSEIIDYVAEVEGPVLEQREVTLKRELEPNLPLILVNANIFQRVLLNLLDNALKVSKRDQTITVSAYVNAKEDAVRICVLDQGPGIPEAYHERIFEKYQRVDNTSTSKGLGLGLAFCKLAMEAHGGKIWVENSTDQGACFCMILPVENQANLNN